MMVKAGIDVGSRTTKVVLLQDGRVVSRAIRPTGWQPLEAAQAVLQEALQQVNLQQNQIGRIVATGYGRVMLPFADETLTEITCHARGAHFLNPEIRTIIDIGGQDSKVIRLDESGFVDDFTMNDRCAAGTGRFLEFLAHTLQVDVADFGKLALQAQRAATVSSMCTVFAESEILSLLAENTPIPEIVAGLHLAISRRIEGLIHQVGFAETVAFTGGVAHNVGMRKTLSDLLGCDLVIPEHPEYVGALGAALS